MDFAKDKIDRVDQRAKNQRSKILNQNPSQKHGKLGDAVRSASSAVTTIGGTVSNVASVVGKVAGKLGFGGLSDALEGSSKVKYHETYGKHSGAGGSDDKENRLKKGERDERSGHSLVDFCQAFSQQSGYRKQIDTECTFEVSFEFQFGNVGLLPSVARILKEYIAPKDTVDKKGMLKTMTEAEMVKLANLGEFDFMDLYIQKMTLPNITLAGGQNVQTLLGEFPINGLYL